MKHTEDNSENIEENNTEYYYGKSLTRCPKTLKKSSDIVISKEINQNCRIFYVFRNYEEFENFYTKEIDIGKRHIYEVIFSSHRFYIDIDVDLKKYKDIDEEKLLEEVVKGLLKVFTDINLHKDIFVYSSHGPMKKSFHILVHRTVNNMNISRKIVKLVKKNISEDFRHFVDENVYKVRQQLRILYSSKYSDPKRIKIFEGQWRFGDRWIQNPIKKQEELKYSLVTLLLDSPNVSQSFENLEIDDTYSNESGVQEVRITKEILNKENGILVRKALEKVREDLQCFFEKEIRQRKLEEQEVIKPYQDETIFLLILKNRGGYMCPIHERIHEHENPFILYTKDSSYFYCRRYQEGEVFRTFCMRYDGERVGKPLKRMKKLNIEKLSEIVDKNYSVFIKKILKDY
jgi:hypothetical protein